MPSSVQPPRRQGRQAAEKGRVRPSHSALNFNHTGGSYAHSQQELLGALGDHFRDELVTRHVGGSEEKALEQPCSLCRSPKAFSSSPFICYFGIAAGRREENTLKVPTLDNSRKPARSRRCRLPAERPPHPAGGGQGHPTAPLSPPTCRDRHVRPPAAEEQQSQGCSSKRLWH